MRSRCYNPNNRSYSNYGGRGIVVCATWRSSFEAFFRDVGEVPSDEHTLDRIDNDGNYELGNVRWATWTEQGRNRRTNHLVTAFGCTKPITAWAEEFGISRYVIAARLIAGWSPEDAIYKARRFSMPKRRDANAPYWQQLREAERSIIVFALEHGQTLRGTAALLGISPNYLSERVAELGISTPDVRPGPKPGTKPNRIVRPELRVVPGAGTPPSAVAEDPEEEELEDKDDEDEDEDDEGDDEDTAPGDEDEDDDQDEGEADDDDDKNDARETGN
jgi:hypothetical protein